MKTVEDFFDSDALKLMRQLCNIDHTIYEFVVNHRHDIDIDDFVTESYQDIINIIDFTGEFTEYIDGFIDDSNYDLFQWLSKDNNEEYVSEAMRTGEAHHCTDFWGYLQAGQRVWAYRMVMQEAQNTIKAMQKVAQTEVDEIERLDRHLIDEVTISEHYLPVIFNADSSGIEDEDEDVAQWLNQYPSGATFDVQDEEPSFMMCEISSMRSNCVTIKIYDFTDNKETQK